MKYYFTSALASILLACGSENTVPEAVLKAFSDKYPEISQVSWESDEDEWEASFSIDELNYEADFDHEGNWQETEVEVSIEELGEEVQGKLNREFADFKIMKSEKVSTPNFEGFEVLISSENQSKEIYISEQGVIHKIDIESEEPYED